MNVRATGAIALIALDGRVDLQPAAAPAIQVGPRGAMLLQPGETVSATNAADRPARLLKFAVEAAQAGG
jgi:hypothetical protein